MKTLIRNSKNILHVENYSKVDGGVTITVKDNKFTAVGTATSYIELWLPLETPLQAGTYSSIIGTERKLFGTGVQSLSLSPKDRDFDNRKGIANINHPIQNATTNFVSNYMAIYIPKGNEVNCSIDLMLNEGDTALPYEPYNKISRMKVLVNENENILYAEDYSKVHNGVTVTVKDNKLTMVGTATKASEGWIPLKHSIPVGTYSSTVGSEQLLKGKRTYLYLSAKVGDYKNRLTFASPYEAVETITTSFVSNYIMFYFPVDAVIDISIDLTLFRKHTFVRNPKNLIPFPYSFESKTSNGVTITALENGQFSIVGTNTSNDAMTFIFKTIKNLPVGEYTISCSYVNGIRFFAQKRVNGKFVINIPVGPSTGYKKRTFSFTEEETNNEIVCHILIEKGFSSDTPVVDGFMLNEGSIAEPYFVPQKITKMKPLMRNSKNLIPFTDHPAYDYLQGVSVTKNSDNTIFLNGTMVNKNFEYTLSYATLFLELGKTYTLSNDNDGDATLYAIVKTRNGTQVTQATHGKPGTFTVTENMRHTDGTYNFRVVLYRYNIRTFDNVLVKVMLNEGSIALPYEPYNKLYNDNSISVRNPKNLIPFPYDKNEMVDYPRGIDFTVNSDGTIILNGQNNSATGNSSYCIAGNITLKAGTYTYNISSSVERNVFLQIRTVDDKYLTVHNGSPAKYTYDTDFTIKALYLIVSAGNTNVFKNTPVTVILNEGTTAEPYFTSRDLIVRQVSNVPSGYQEVEYLESTGTQYIDTGLKVNNSVRMIHIGHMKDTVGTYDMPLCGVRQSSESDSTLCIWYNTTKGISTPLLRVIVGGKSSNYKYFTTDVYNENHTLEVNNKKVYFDNEAILSIPDPIYTETSNETLPLFALRTGSTIDDRKWRGVTKKVILYMDDKLVRNFIPCYRKKDKVAGLYDTVSGKFFTNNGTGEFITGLPKEYQEVEYLESTGTQYIDTGVIPTLNTKIETKYSQSSYDKFIYGSRTSTSTADKHTFCQSYETSCVPQLGSSIIDQYPSTYTLNAVATLVNGKDGCYRDGTKISENRYDNITFTQSTLPMYLFGLNTPNEEFTKRALVGDIYYFKIWENGTLIRDFIPCYRKKDNVAGMYDTITKKFFTNGGAGNFLIGNKI